MILVIGKNSRIVKDIKEDLDPSYFKFISHKELCEVNLNSYKRILLFSWSEKLAENLGMLAALPINKVVFISSSSVFSVSQGRAWNRYPKYKAEVERVVLDGGGCVARIGVYFSDIKSRIYGCFADTKKEDLINFINSLRKDEEFCMGKVVNLFYRSNGGHLHPSFIERLLWRISDILPPVGIIQNPISVILKKLGSINYGYTRESNKIFKNNVLIGFGAIGKEIEGKFDIDLVVAKDEVDRILPGCCGAGIIPEAKHGLSKYWHGVSVVYSGRHKGVVKKVPFFVKRNNGIISRLRNKSKIMLLGKGERVKWLDEEKIIISSARGVCDIPIYYKKLVLASGCIGNIRIVSKLKNKAVSIKEEVFLDEHIVFNLGWIYHDDAVRYGLIRTFGPLMFRGKLIRTRNEIFDFRPYSKRDYSSVYMQTTLGVMGKIFSRFSFDLLNEACFNKFGVALLTDRISVHCQRIVKDYYRLNLKDDRIGCKSVKDVVQYIDMSVQKFSALYPWRYFSASGKYSFIAGQHVYKCIDGISLPPNIFAAGCPSLRFNLGGVHHTNRLKRKSLRMAKIFLEKEF